MMSEFKCPTHPLITDSVIMTHEQKWAYRKLQNIHRKSVKKGLLEHEQITNLAEAVSQHLKPKERLRFYSAITTIGNSNVESTNSDPIDKALNEDVARAFSRYANFPTTPAQYAIESYKKDFRERLKTRPGQEWDDIIRDQVELDNSKALVKYSRRLRKASSDIQWLFGRVKQLGKMTLSNGQEHMFTETKKPGIQHIIGYNKHLHKINRRSLLKGTRTVANTTVKELGLWINGTKNFKKKGRFFGTWYPPALNRLMKADEIAQHYKNGDFWGISAMLVLEAMSLPGMPLQVKALGKAISLTSIVSKEAGSKIGELKAKYIDQRDAVIASLPSEYAVDVEFKDQFFREDKSSPIGVKSIEATVDLGGSYSVNLLEGVIDDSPIRLVPKVSITGIALKETKEFDTRQVVTDINNNIYTTNIGGEFTFTPNKKFESEQEIEVRYTVEDACGNTESEKIILNVKPADVVKPIECNYLYSEKHRTYVDECKGDFIDAFVETGDLYNEPGNYDDQRVDTFILEDKTDWSKDGKVLKGYEIDLIYNTPGSHKAVLTVGYEEPNRIQRYIQFVDYDQAFVSEKLKAENKSLAHYGLPPKTFQQVEDDLIGLLNHAYTTPEYINGKYNDKYKEWGWEEPLITFMDRPQEITVHISGFESVNPDWTTRDNVWESKDFSTQYQLTLMPVWE